jgi:hypothetical protein
LNTFVRRSYYFVIAIFDFDLFLSKNSKCRVSEVSREFQSVLFHLPVSSLAGEAEAEAEAAALQQNPPAGTNKWSVEGGDINTNATLEAFHK